MTIADLFSKTQKVSFMTDAEGQKHTRMAIIKSNLGTASFLIANSYHRRYEYHLQNVPLLIKKGIVETLGMWVLTRIYTRFFFMAKKYFVAPELFYGQHF